MSVMRQIVWWYTWYVVLVLVFGAVLGLGAWLVARLRVRRHRRLERRSRNEVPRGVRQPAWRRAPYRMKAGQML